MNDVQLKPVNVFLNIYIIGSDQLILSSNKQFFICIIIFYVIMIIYIYHTYIKWKCTDMITATEFLTIYLVLFNIY